MDLRSMINAGDDPPEEGAGCRIRSDGRPSAGKRWGIPGRIQDDWRIPPLKPPYMER